MPDFRFDPETGLFVSATGATITAATLRRLRNLWADAQAGEIADLVAGLGAGKLPFDAFESNLRTWIATTVIGGYLLGRGGRAMLTGNDLFTVGAMVSDLVQRVERWLVELAVGRITLPQFGARAEGAAGSSVTAFDKGREAGREGLSLPYYPADGGTECFDRCRCWWDIEEYDDHWEATWHTMNDESVCPGCLDREAESSPFVQERL